MAGLHCDGVVLPTRQVEEVTVGVGAVALGVVAQIAPSVDGVRRGTECRVPHNPGDTGLAVHLCHEVGGNTWGWWEEREAESLFV